MVRYDFRTGVKKIKTKTGLAISGLTLGAAGLGMAVAIPLVTHADSTNITFEPPTYSVGNINGQDGWSKTGSYDVAVVSNTYGYSSFGTQSLRTSDAVTSGSFGNQTFSKSLANEAGESDALNNGYSGGTRQPHFEAQFDFASVLPTVQTGMHVSVSPDRGDGARMSYLRFEDHSTADVYTADTADATHPVGSHYTDGIHVYFDDVQGTTNPANFVETDIATITRSPHTIKFSMDFLNGPSNDVVKIYIDGNLVKTGTSWENYYRFDSESNPGLAQNDSRTVDSLLFRESGTANPSDSGKGFLVDNLTLSSGSIPANLPNSKDQCMNNGWKTYGVFKNQGDCVSFVATKGKNQPTGSQPQTPANHSATGTISLDNPTQTLSLNVYDNGQSASDTGFVTYSNPSASLIYTTPPTCVNVVGSTAYIAYVIPSGNPYSGTWVVWKVVDGGSSDTAGFTTAADMASANALCEGASASVTNYAITAGDILVQ